MTNEKVKDVFNAFYGGWWKQFRDVSPVTEVTLEQAYQTGLKIEQEYDSMLAAHLFAAFLSELHDRQKQANRTATKYCYSVTRRVDNDVYSTKDTGGGQK
jgi:hypothetical protein